MSAAVVQGVTDIQLCTMIHFDDGNVSEGFYASVHCLIPHMYAKLRVQNETLIKIN